MMTDNIKTTPAINLVMRLSAEGKTVFSIEEARDVSQFDNRHLEKVLQSLVERGWIKRIERGKYLVIPLEAGPDRRWSEEAFVIASSLIDPYAVSYWSALNYWQLTEQIPTTIFVQSSKRKPSKEVLGISFKFIFVPKKKFFGLIDIWFGDKKVQITDKEKTIVDCLDHPEYCGGMIEASKGLVNGIEAGIDLENLTAYAERLNNSTILKRLGYLSEILNLPTQDFSDKWRELIGAGYSLFDPSRGVEQGRYYSKWNLRLNVSEDELTSWRDH